MCEFVEKYFQIILSRFNKSILNNLKTIKTFKSRCENDLSLRQQRHQTKTTNTNFEIENISRSKLSSFFKT